MNKKDLLPFCRYYKGETKNPFDEKDQDKAMLWFYENCWIEQVSTGKGKEIMMEYISEYSNAGLSMFEINDEIPVSLKALLFNRYSRGAYSMADAVEPFKEFYHKYYK